MLGLHICKFTDNNNIIFLFSLLLIVLLLLEEDETLPSYTDDKDKITVQFDDPPEQYSIEHHKVYYNFN